MDGCHAGGTSYPRDLAVLARASTAPMMPCIQDVWCPWGSRARARAVGKKQLAGAATREHALLLVAAVSGLLAIATADQSAPEPSSWIEVSSTEDIQTALSAATNETSLEVSSSVSRCAVVCFRTVLHCIWLNTQPVDRQLSAPCYGSVRMCLRCELLTGMVGIC